MEGISVLFKVIWSPGEAMLRAAKNSKTALAPILLLTIAGIIFTMIMFSHVSMGEIALRAMEQSGRAQQLTPEQKERFLTASNGPVPKVISTVAATVGPTMTVAVVALIFFGVFSIVGRDGPFKSFFSVTAFACVPLIVRNIASVATVMIVPQSSLMVDEIGSISPAIFLDRTSVSKAVFTLVNQLDVVSIWILILLVIGYRFVARKSVSATMRAVCVFGVWLVWVLARVALSSVFPA